MAGRIGVEVEFSGLSSRAAAQVVAATLGGSAQELDPHRYAVATPLGRFLIELDMSRAHPRHDPAKADGLLAKLDSGMAQVIGDLGGLWMPQELICPPLPVEDLPRIDALLAALRRAGALGSGASPLFAYGLHLNIEEREITPPRLLAVIRAYLLLQDWLAERCCRDLTRRLLRFAAPFPASYLRQALRPGYSPDMTQLAADYLAQNPTRNRGLDLLPILGLKTPELVAAAVEHPCLAARPTYHFRLPDSRIDEDGWTAAGGALEAWTQVERLAADPQRLTRLSALCLDWLERPALSRTPWSSLVAEHLERGEVAAESQVRTRQDAAA